MAINADGILFLKVLGQNSIIAMAKKPNIMAIKFGENPKWPYDRNFSIRLLPEDLVSKKLSICPKANTTATPDVKPVNTAEGINDINLPI